MGGTGGRGMFAGAGASTLAELWRGRIVSVTEGGYDLKGLARSVAAHVTALMEG